jgi:hypothetical protein
VVLGAAFAPAITRDGLEIPENAQKPMTARGQNPTRTAPTAKTGDAETDILGAVDDGNMVRGGSPPHYPPVLAARPQVETSGSCASAPTNGRLRGRRCLRWGLQTQTSEFIQKGISITEFGDGRTFEWPFREETVDFRIPRRPGECPLNVHVNWSAAHRACDRDTRISCYAHPPGP